MVTARYRDQGVGHHSGQSGSGMTSLRRVAVGSALAAVLCLMTSNAALPEDKKAEDKGVRPLSIVVMDPLAAPLSCPCVKGYAQRKYEKLGEYLESQLKRPVQVSFSESLDKALKGDAKGHADLIIGKDSVVRADAKSAEIKVEATAALSGKDGSTTQTGLVVVRTSDPAKSVADLKGYRIIFGSAIADEKHAAAVKLLESAGVEAPQPADRECCDACSDGATIIVESPEDARIATVISSYAKPLLEGCGTVEKGALRVIGETSPLPFVVAYLNTELPAAERAKIHDLLLEVRDDAALCSALETKDGFVEVSKTVAEAKKKLTP